METNLDQIFQAHLQEGFAVAILRSRGPWLVKMWNGHGSGKGSGLL
jgi:hypothetical protein